MYHDFLSRAIVGAMFSGLSSQDVSVIFIVLPTPHLCKGCSILEVVRFNDTVFGSILMLSFLRVFQLVLNLVSDGMLGMVNWVEL